MKKKDESLVNILNKIENRIKFFDEEKKSDYAKLERLQNLFGKDIDSLTLEDIQKEPLTKLKDVAEIIKEQRDYFDDDFLTSETGQIKLVEFIKEFITKTRESMAYLEMNISKCSFYADILTSKKMDDYFVDSSDYNNFINTLGILKSEQVVAQRIFAEKTLGAIKHDPEIIQTATYYKSEFVDRYPDIRDAVLNYFQENGIKFNADYIKMYAMDVAKTCGHSLELVNNVIASMLVSKATANYIKTNEKKYLKQMNSFFKLELSEKNVVIAEANLIISAEHDNLRHSKYESINDIVVTDSASVEEFEELKAKKKTNLAHKLNEVVDGYYRNNNTDRDEEFKTIIYGLMEEYYRTDSLVFTEKTEKTR